MLQWEKVVHLNAYTELAGSGGFADPQVRPLCNHSYEGHISERGKEAAAHPVHQNGTEPFELMMANTQSHPEHTLSSQDAACTCRPEVHEDIFNKCTYALAGDNEK